MKGPQLAILAIISTVVVDAMVTAQNFSGITSTLANILIWMPVAGALVYATKDFR